MSTDFCTFWVGEELYGIPVSEVQEVLREQAMTRVPLAPPSVRGLLNLRGQVVTAIDLRVRLGLQVDETSGKVCVVVRHRDAVLSLLVDEIDDVKSCAESARVDVPDTLPEKVRGFLSSVVKLERRLLLALDVAAITKIDTTN